MSRVVHFEINTPDVEKATAFYESVFGWRFQKWDGPETYWLITTGENGSPGINGGMMSMQEEWPQTVNIVGVDSVDTFTEKITQHGGEVIVPKMAIPGVGYSAYYKDPSGVVFGVFEENSAAA
ncbi:MAG: VOC family protein [Rhodothermales bacterium]